MYQSGNLLLHLLNDLLTFSKNQVEQAIQLEEREFKLTDIRSQLAIIFQNQVQEKQIDFTVKCMLYGSLQPRQLNGSLCREADSKLSYPVPQGILTRKLMNMLLCGD